MASPAPWLRWTQTELTRWEGEEEELEEDDFERQMDDDGVISLGEDAGSPPWGNGEDLEEGSPAEEGHWHPQQDQLQEEEERGSSGADEGPWGAESDGDPYPELSYEGLWGSESSGSPKVLRDGQALCQPRGCSTDGGDTSGLSDTSPGPATPSHRGWGTARNDSGGHRQGWTPSQSLLLDISPSVTSVGPITEPQPAGMGLPGTAGLAPTREPWGAGTPSAPQQCDGSRVPKKAVPKLLQPKRGQKSPSLSSRWRHTGGKEMKDPSGSGTGTAEGTQYGRGRLNHPLPDLSKVEARVKFDQSYRPPRGRELPACPRATGGPISFKSPAEIVREVLLSSGEGVPPQPPTSTRLPQEFRSPKQATALVQQLQDDYHKLLTKYAEAENTIDQLRLGARVSLYADPPQPSRSLTTGRLPTGCHMMSLSIPRASTAALSTATASPSSSGGGPSDLVGSSSSPQPEGGCPTCTGHCCCVGTGTQVTRTLAGQTRKLQAQVEALEGWMRARIPAPQEQLQVHLPHRSPPPRGCTGGSGVPGSSDQAGGSVVAAAVSQWFWKLKETQDALEQAYLRARQQHPETSGDFDPDRAVEGEIFHLGLRLEMLKEQLEPRAGQQLTLEPPAQPRSPPAPSSLPDTHSPCLESPALMEGPQGAAEDNEAGMEGLPQPLWHKQLQVEEDFGDLLAQYKHFKSLPESLSLEQLSLAGNESLEEVDGPVAGDSSPSKIPCRTQSLEEGADLKISSLHPLERRSAPLSPKELPWPGGTQDHLFPATTEELPATAQPPLGLPEPPRAPLSHHSSGAGSTGPQHQPLKEQRIVSPETDSGFVGSETSRVSPTVHTPEHRPPSNTTPSLLGPSIRIPATLRSPRKKEVTPLPSKPVLMGIYPTGKQDGAGEPCQSPSSPQRWAESGGSEVEANCDGSRTDSEVEGRSCASSHPTTRARGPENPSPAPETPSPTPPSPDPAHWDLLGSRLERDRAIRALRDEVWQLRRSLEESLRRSRSYPEGKATPSRRQPVASRLSSPRNAAPSGELSPPVWGRTAPRIAAARKGRSASLPRDRTKLDMTSKSDPLPTRTRATSSLQRSPGSAPAAMTVCGQYTGTRYQAGMPHTVPAPREESGTPRCSQCRGSRTPSATSRLGDTTRQPRHSTPRRTRCPACQAPMGAPAPGSRDGATHERAERVPGVTSPLGSRIDPQAEKLEQPGFWYLAASPAAPATIGCLAPIPLVPYTPSVLYCSPAVPTSAPAMAGVPPQHSAGHRRAEHPRRPHANSHRHCLALEELNQSLSWAVEAAQSMKVTTTRMSRVLATELSRAQDLRGSCLF